MHAACWPRASPHFLSTCSSGLRYKGITLAATLAVELARRGHNVPLAFNRKEAKDHGEGGTLIGAPVRGRVLIVDDVISAGTSVRESVTIINAAGAQPCGVAIALDRKERTSDAVVPGQAAVSAVQFVERELQLPVLAIATLDDLLGFLRSFQHQQRAGRVRRPGAGLPRPLRSLNAAQPLHVSLLGRRHGARLAYRCACCT